MSDQLLEPTMGSQSTLPNASTTLVLGIVSLVGCFLWGLPGLVCGIIGLILHKKDKALYLSNPSTYQESYKTAKAGYVCSLIGVILSSIVFAIIIFYFIFAIALFSTLNPTFR